MDNKSFVQHMLANQDYRSLAVAKLEESVIRAIYKLHDADARFNWELKECKKQRRTMEFSWFQEMFPAFPAILRVAKVDHVFNVSWTALFGPAFFKQPWACEYLDLVDQLQIKMQKEWLAMVFRVPHAEKANLMVMHNASEDIPSTTGDWTCITRTKNNVRFTVEPLAAFIERTGTAWFQHAFENPNDY